MIQFVKKLFGMGPQTNYKDLVKNGAVIVDVRSRSEFSSGHVRNALNIPLNELTGGMKDLPTNKVIITCCASGIRSSAAKSMLTASGYKEVYNGGGWMSLNGKLEN